MIVNGFFKAFFAIIWNILMVFFVKFWGIKILALLITNRNKSWLKMTVR